MLVTYFMEKLIVFLQRFSEYFFWKVESEGIIIEMTGPKFDTWIFLLLLFLFFFVFYHLLFSNITNNILRILFLIEILMLLGSFLFLIAGLHYDDMYGQVVVLFLLTIAAVEAAVGLALIYSYYRLWHTVKLSKISKIKG